MQKAGRECGQDVSVLRGEMIPCIWVNSVVGVSVGYSWDGVKVENLDILGMTSTN